MCHVLVPTMYHRQAIKCEIRKIVSSCRLTRIALMTGRSVSWYRSNSFFTRNTRSTATLIPNKRNRPVSDDVACHFFAQAL
eukprot:COSAG06_NODE_5484_length_3448_cov_6.842938_2_plen_81_part_00